MRNSITTTATTYTDRNRQDCNRVADVEIVRISHSLRMYHLGRRGLKSFAELSIAGEMAGYQPQISGAIRAREQSCSVAPGSPVSRQWRPVRSQASRRID